MNTMARFGGLRLLLCTSALLAWSEGSAHADTKKKDDGIKAQNGAEGNFIVRLTGYSTKVHAITAEFKPQFPINNNFEILNWQVKIEFFDKQGKPYGSPITQGINPGPNKSGRFEWIPQRVGGQPVREGQIHVSLFEKRKGKMTRIGLVKWDIKSGV